MIKRTKWLVAFLAILILFVLWAVTSFTGLPWKEKRVAGQLEAHLEEEYQQDFELKTSYFNFKDGRYGGVFYPKKNPRMEFHADEGHGSYKYIDGYPEVVWAQQLKEDIKLDIERSFPHLQLVHTAAVMHQSMDTVKGTAVPHYSETEALLYAGIETKGAFTGSSEQWEAITESVRTIQSKTAFTDIGFQFIETKRNAITHVSCPPKDTAAITTIQQAQAQCSSSGPYDLETGQLVQ